MYTFFQESLRKTIKQDIYKEKTISITLRGTLYRAIKKEKKIGPMSVYWLQVLGVVIPDDDQLVRDEVVRIRRLYPLSSGCIFIQLGIVNEIARFPNLSRQDPLYIASIRQARLDVQARLANLGLHTAWRENMPQSTIVINTSKSDAELITDMNSGCKERIRKATNHGLMFRSIVPAEYNDFYSQRSLLSDHKHFSIISKSTFDRLMSYLHDNVCGDIFIVTTADGELLGGSICVYDVKQLTYIYGFSSRNPAYRNIGIHHFLKYKMFGRARERNIYTVDLRGGAPTGFPEHSLTSVSQFKESLGGEKIEWYGSYDISSNEVLYILLRYCNTFRKKSKKWLQLVPNMSIYISMLWKRSIQKLLYR